MTIWQQWQQEIGKGPTGIMEERGTEHLHHGKEKDFGKRSLKIIEAEKQKNKQEICKNHFSAARGISFVVFSFV